MNKTLAVLGLVFGVGVFAGVGCGDSDDGGGDCTKVCQTAASLKCGTETEASCKTGCEQVRTQVPNCKSQVDAFLKCSAARPASDFVCEAGEAELKDGICDPEGAALLACAAGGS